MAKSKSRLRVSVAFLIVFQFCTGCKEGDVSGGDTPDQLGSTLRDAKFTIFKKYQDEWRLAVRD